MRLEETIFYYTKNNYLLINTFLLGNIDKFWEVAEIANADYQGVLAEYENGVRQPDLEDIEMRKRRVYKKLDAKTKAKILDATQKDINNIFNAMRPTNKEITLFRNVRAGDEPEFYDVGKTIDLKTILSSSIMPYEKSYSGSQDDFLRYEIMIPKGTPVLYLDQFKENIRNESGEVLLPPMKCVVENVRDGEDLHCKKIIELKCVQIHFPLARQTQSRLNARGLKPC